MAKTTFDNGFIIVKIRHVIERPDGSLFYQRRVPKGLEGHHGGKALIRKSLRTKSPQIALKRAERLTNEHDVLWRMLRAPGAIDQGLTTQDTRDGATALAAALGLVTEEPYPWLIDPMDQYLSGKYGDDYNEARWGEHRDDDELFKILNPVEAEVMRQIYEEPGGKRYHLSDALEMYLKEHKKGDEPKFSLDTKRNIQHVIDTVGDLPLDKYERDHARRVVESLSARGCKTGTVRRQIRCINAVLNHGIREFDLKITNPFRELRIKGEGDDAEKRPSFTMVELKAIQQACRKKDDDIRQIVGMHSDLGCRAGEVIGLRVEDVFLGGPVPHVWFRPYVKLGRTLKTDTSERKVPLVGVALWAAKRAVECAAKHPKGNGWLFPRYASDGEIKATGAENIINKWLKSLPGIDKTTHSFRHAMRDRLREVRAPEEIQNDVGGWGGKTIGQGYGEGYSLERMQEYLLKVVLPSEGSALSS